MKTSVCVAIFILLIARWASCDVIYLKSGGFFEGEVIEESAEKVKLNSPKTGTLTLNKSDIEKISREERPPDVLEAYKKRKLEIKDCDAEAQYKLGEWCLSSGLYAFAEKEFNRAAECSPDYRAAADEGIRRAGLYKKFEEAEYLAGIGAYTKARGLVEEILNGSPPVELKEKLIKLLSDIEKGEKESGQTVSTPLDSADKTKREIRLVRSIQSLARLINNAEESVYCGAFSIDNPAVFSALISARLKGVEVRALIGKGNLKAEMVQLRSIGADVKEVASPQGVANLFFIIDDRYLWLSPYGLATRGQLMERASALLIGHQPLVKAYSMEYAQLYTGTTKVKLQEKNEFLTPDFYIENYFTPDEKVKDRLFEEIDKSRKSIFFCTPRFEDKSLRNKMIDKAKEGITVEGIFERQYKNPVYDAMLKSGLTVRKNSNPYNIFSTVVVLDGKVLVIGSFTMEKKFWQNPNQSLLFIYDREMANNFYEECKEFF